ncbi:unnamed protein product, partial [Didymodactylos carnosus]
MIPFEAVNINIHPTSSDKRHDDTIREPYHSCPNTNQLVTTNPEHQQLSKGKLDAMTASQVFEGTLRAKCHPTKQVSSKDSVNSFPLHIRSLSRTAKSDTNRSSKSNRIPCSQPINDFPQMRGKALMIGDNIPMVPSCSSKTLSTDISKPQLLNNASNILINGEQLCRIATPLAARNKSPALLCDPLALSNPTTCLALKKSESFSYSNLAREYLSSSDTSDDEDAILKSRSFTLHKTRVESKLQSKQPLEALTLTPLNEHTVRTLKDRIFSQNPNRSIS